MNWRWTIPDLTTTHRVVAPDLPAHGSTGSGDDPLDAFLRALRTELDRSTTTP